MNFIEDAQLSKVTRTEGGYLAAMVRCARTGIQTYAGHELGINDQETIRVYRPEEEVFSTDSLKTYVGKPITDNHPSEQVNADNWKDHAAGSIGQQILRDGQFISVPITLMDAAVVKKVDEGKCELSMGYTMDLEFSAGETESGEAYDAIARNMNMNHLAIVQRGRAGHECRIGDSSGNQWGAAPQTTRGNDMSDKKLVTVAVDGLSVETTDQGAQAINKLQETNDSLTAKIDQIGTDHQAVIDAKDGEIAKRDAEIDSLKDKQLSDADIDALVTKRADLVSSASKIAKDTDFSGMSEGDIKRAAVTALRGEDSVLDKSDAYIEAAFDLAVESAESNDGEDDPMRKHLKGRDSSHQANDNGQEGYETRLTSAYKQ